MADNLQDVASLHHSLYFNGLWLAHGSKKVLVSGKMKKI